MRFDLTIIDEIFWIFYGMSICRSISVFDNRTRKHFHGHWSPKIACLPVEIRVSSPTSRSMVKIGKNRG